MKCLTLAKLLNYLQNPADNRERAGISLHLSAGCRVCNENLQWLEVVISSAARDQSFEFPEETIAAIVARFKQQTAAGLRPIRQYIARLIFDSGTLPQLAGARMPSKKAARRQALYQAEGYDIDLIFLFSAEHNDEQLTGQVVPEHGDATELTPFKVELLQHDSVISATNTDKHGVFEFSQLISGTYDLKVFVPDGEIKLERVSTARAL